MVELSESLTPTDKVILESYKHLCEGLSEYIGEGYEIVLHSLEDYNHSVIKIINGYHTGRSEGAPITDFALSMLGKIETQKGKGYITYLTRNKQGEPLKSSTITIQGEGGRIIGLLCINFYLNTPLNHILQNFYPPMGNHTETERFVDNTEELILAAIEEVRKEVISDPTVSGINKNKEIVTRLHGRGVFNLKDAVVKTADFLGISKNTVYMHLRNINGV